MRPELAKNNVRVRDTISLLISLHIRLRYSYPLFTVQVPRGCVDGSGRQMLLSTSSLIVPEPRDGASERVFL